MNEKDTKQLAEALVEEMKGTFATKDDLDKFPTAEIVQAGFESTASEADLISAIRTAREYMRQEMNARFDKIERNQTVMHLKKLDKEMTVVYKQLRVLEETKADVGAK